MNPEEVRKIIDQIKKWQKEHHTKFKNGQEFWIYFYTELFNLLLKK